MQHIILIRFDLHSACGQRVIAERIPLQYRVMDQRRVFHLILCELKRQFSVPLLNFLKVPVCVDSFRPRFHIRADKILIRFRER